MASWNLPDLANKISTDIPAIRQLLQALRIWGGTHDDEPEGAKKLVDVTQNSTRVGCQIQQLSSGAWGSVGKLMHDCDTVDGFHASKSATANAVAVRDSSGVLAGKAQQAGEALSIASSYTVPVNRGGTGATTAQGARENIGANNAGNITAGVLAVARGGTGNSSGLAPDVATSYSYLGQNNSAAPTSASATGQVGLSALRAGIDCDSHRFPGRYICTGATIALHYPCTGNVTVDVIAGKAGTASNSAVVIIQRAYSPDGLQAWRRVSTNAGASWSGWHPEDFSASSASIYIVGTGDDANYGLDSSHPVKTVARALEIAKELKIHGTLTLRFGANSGGSWGNVTIRGTALSCDAVVVTNFANSNKTTKATFDALTDVPLFGTLTLEQGRFAIGNVKANAIGLDGSFLTSTKWMQVGRFYAGNAWLNIDSGITVVRQENSGTKPLFDLSCSGLRIAGVVFDFSDSPLNSSFISVADGADIYVSSSFSSSGTFAGKKYSFEGTANVRSGGKKPTAWPGNTAGTGDYLVGGVPTNAMQVSQVPSGVTWVGGVKEGGALVTSKTTGFGALLNAKTKNHRVALATWPGTNDLVYLFSVTDANVSANTNTAKQSLTWNADTGELVATKFSGPLNGNANTATKATQDGSGNVITSTYLPKTGGTVTGTLILSKTTDLSGTANNKPALIVGGTDTQAHTEFDSNEIQAKANGTSVAALELNHDGGAVKINNKRAVVGASTGSGTKHVYSDANGVLQASAANVGSESQPMYLKAGVMTPCSNLAESSMVPNANPVEISNNTDYTAATNGFLKVEANWNGTVESQDSWNCKVTINGHETNVTAAWASGERGYWTPSDDWGNSYWVAPWWHFTNGCAFFAPVRKGWTYRVSGATWCAFQSCG